MANLRVVKINDHVHYIGVNDRYTHLFEAMWPLPDGISYNSYLFDGGSETCLIDCVRIDSVQEFMDNLVKALGDRPLDYVVVNHMEPDHTSSLRMVIEHFPDVKIVTNKKAVKMMNNFYKIGEDNVKVVGDGETLAIGERELTFYTTPMVHWPESMVCFEEESGILFSQDAFGGFGTLDGAIFDDQVEWDKYREETIRYYTNIVGKYSVQVIRALKKLEGLDIKMICPDHGPVWRENIERIVTLYSDLSEQKTEDGVLIVYGSMYGNTEIMAEALARALTEEGVRNIRIRDVSKTHLSYLISETWLYKGIILGCPTYNVGLFPPMAQLVEVLKKQKMKNHVLGTFTNYTWGGGAEKEFAAFAEESKWDVLPTTIDVMGLPGDDDYEKCRQMAKEMAKALKK
ncbi:MAG: FprA family A-type flavoprotein [Peptoniphilus sp.]|nr:FprA family A-type flavoprotein [Peptoniphilus sp.]MDD7363055.1 FprA family A-type flavoprotein [Bacillota bacterium]MDY6045320.1 FprA family A-type flavoprotein [Peptoniphilus sp.]